MSNKIILLSFLILCFTFVAEAQNKNQDWQTGKVVDTESDKYKEYLGSTIETAKPDNNGNTSSKVSDVTVDRWSSTVVIDTGNTILVGDRDTPNPWRKAPTLTVNGDAKYVIKGERLTILDDKNKKYNFKIRKKILKENN